VFPERLEAHRAIDREGLKSDPHVNFGFDDHSGASPRF
jgi:hypothetical protein